MSIPSPVPQSAARQAAVLVVGLVALVALVFVAFALPGARTAPRDVPIGLAGPAPAVAQVQQGLAQAAPGAFTVTAYPDGDSLRAAVRDRQVYGGFVLAPQQAPVTVVATGGSPVVAQALTATGQQLAARQGAQSTVEDLAPLPADDARGLGLAGAGLPVAIGGLVPALLLIRRFPARPWLRVATATTFALLTGLTLAAVLQFWFGSIDAGFVRVGLGLSLGLGAISLLVLGLGSLLGRAGLAIGGVLVMLLGNPLSGLTSAPELLPSGWGALGQLLPPGANATLLRSGAYFDGAGAGGPVLVLAGWALVGLLLVAAGARRRRGALTQARAVPAQPVAVPAA